MIIDCVSDTHGRYPTLEGGDLLIFAGDIQGTGSARECEVFYEWLSDQQYKEKIVIAGNHDNFLQEIPEFFKVLGGCKYLCDSGTEFEGLKIWGSPWTKRFEGMNPDCMAFTVDTDEQLAEKWLTFPLDVDIMVTHSPLYGILDRTSSACVGSETLKVAIQKTKPSILICGHVHECGGCIKQFENTLIVNASHVNEFYKPINKPIRIIGEKGAWKAI